MIEKMSEYEGTQFLAKEGKFVFTITSYELTTSSAGTPTAKFEVKCSDGVATIYHSLNPKARWSYNSLIKACLHLNTPEKIAKFELDYETVGNDLIDKTFIGVVECETYDKEVSTPNEDGTFSRTIEKRDSYKIKSYEECK